MTVSNNMQRVRVRLRRVALRERERRWDARQLTRKRQTNIPLLTPFHPSPLSRKSDRTYPYTVSPVAAVTVPFAVTVAVAVVFFVAVFVAVTVAVTVAVAVAVAVTVHVVAIAVAVTTATLREPDVRAQMCKCFYACVFRGRHHHTKKNFQNDM